jgi:hypothetical protein
MLIDRIIIYKLIANLRQINSILMSKNNNESMLNDFSSYIINNVRIKF